MRSSRIGCLLLIGILMFAVGGCMSSSGGTASLTGDKVNEIKKGVTTRKDIESMFGQCTQVMMMPQGKHILSYYFSQSDVHASPEAYIPVVNMFESKSEGQTQMRTLQINLDANDVVEDYQFNDSTNNVEATGSMMGLGMSTKSTPVTTQK